MYTFFTAYSSVYQTKTLFLPFLNFKKLEDKTDKFLFVLELRLVLDGTMSLFCLVESGVFVFTSCRRSFHLFGLILLGVLVTFVLGGIVCFSEA